MYATELRIGNLVAHAMNPKMIYAIIEIMEGEVVVQIYGGRAKFAYDYSNISPVPVTHELLENWGFDVHPDGSYYFNGVNIHISPEGYYFKYGQYVISNRVIKYMNELQNLFHSLTNTELKHK